MPNRTNYKNGRSTKSKPVTAAGVVAPKPVDVDSVEDVEAPIILPYLEEDEGPPIPIPVPRSQTPQLVVLQEEYTPPQQQRYEEVFEAPLPLAVDEPAHNQQQREYEGALKALETPPPRPVLHVEDQRIGSHSRRYDDDFENALDNPVPTPEPRQQPRRTPRPTVNVHTTPPVPAFQVQVPDLHDPDPDPELAPDRFSYAYGFTPASPSRSPSSGSRISSQLRSPPRSPPRVSAPGSGLARTIRAQAVSPSPSPSRIGQGFVPTPAVPVVDLGMAGAGVEYRVPVGDGDGYENVQYRGALKGKAPREEEILWARWDEVVLPTNRRSTRLLLVAYPSTLRIWDTTDLENVVEVLRLPIADMEEGGNEERNEDDGPMLVHAAVLPDTAGNVGLAFSTGQFIVYSLKTHRVITRFPVGHATLPPPARGGGSWKTNTSRGAQIDGFEASAQVLVVSTTSPAALHVFRTSTFEHILEIPGARLALYVPPILGGPAGVQAGVVTLGSAKALLNSAIKGVVGVVQQNVNAGAGNGGRGGGYVGGNGNMNTTTARPRDARDPNYTMYDTNTDTGTRNSIHNIDNNNNSNSNNNVLLPSSSHPSITPPKSIYALSHRLLAYASSASSTSSPSPPSPMRPTPVQAAAQSVWGGMRTLGGMAVSAARSRMGSVDMGVGAGGGAPAGVGRFFSRSAPEGNREREDSDPGGERDGERAGDLGGGGAWVTVVDLAPLLRGDAAGGKGKGKGDVVVEFPVDKDRPLARLSFTYDGCSIGAVSWDGQGVKIYQIRPQPPQLASSGSSSPHSHSHSTHIQSSHSHSPSSTSAEGRTGSAWQVYHLRRGRTGAVVDGLEWSRDGRWAALGTRKGTVHVFGVNPYGGRPDVKSHWEGRVRNVDATQSMPTEMGPLVRLRAGTTPAPSPIPTTGYAQHARTPLAFTFVESSTTLPPHLLPTHASSPPQNAGSSHSRSYSSSHHTTTDTGVSPPPPRSPVHRTTSNNNNGRPTNYQDVLMFDPVDASLALRRVVLEMRPREQGMGMGIIDKRVSMGMTSISLPGMGFAGALSSSPSSASGGGGGAFGAGYRALQQQHHSQLQQEVQMELGARESTVMTWSLGGWQAGDVRKILGAESMMGEDTGGDKEVKGGRADWLAQAELSTCSKSSRLLPRSIYLSHQFSFHTLGEDYHALIRRYQLDIGGTKIDVRREVQVSAYSAGSGGESFVEGFASPRDIRHHRTLSSSFDEPLASALTNELVHPHTSGVLPMLPNGTPGAQAFRNPIPIRTIGDGMSESLGRLRREINKVRSPRLRPRPDSVMSASVPLEFDEEDEDFVGPGVDRGVSMSMSMSMGVESERERDTLEVPVSSSSRETSRDAGDSGSGPTVSTPATSEDDWEREAVVEKAVVEDTWGGWSAQDKLAVEEVERFDNIDVLGLLDEEQAPVGVRPPAAPQVVAGEARRKGRARRRG